MKIIMIMLVVIVLSAIIFEYVTDGGFPSQDVITREDAIQHSRVNAEANCMSILSNRYSDYRRYILKKGYSPRDPAAEEFLRQSILYSNDSIFIIKRNNDRFTFKYKVYMDSVNFDYDLKLIEEYIHLDDYKKYPNY